MIKRLFKHLIAKIIGLILGILLVAFAVIELCGFRFIPENALKGDEKDLANAFIYESDMVLFCNSTEMVDETGRPVADLYTLVRPVKRYGRFLYKQQKAFEPVYELYDEDGTYFAKLYRFESNGRFGWFMQHDCAENDVGEWYLKRTALINGSELYLYKGAYFATQIDKITTLELNGHALEVRPCAD